MISPCACSVSHILNFSSHSSTIAYNSCIAVQCLVSLSCHNPTQQTGGQQIPCSTDHFCPSHVTRKTPVCRATLLVSQMHAQMHAHLEGRCCYIAPQHKVLPPEGVLGLGKVSERMGSSSSSEVLLLSCNLMCKTSPFSHYRTWCFCMPSRHLKGFVIPVDHCRGPSNPLLWVFFNHDSNII